MHEITRDSLSVCSTTLGSVLPWCPGVGVRPTFAIAMGQITSKANLRLPLHVQKLKLFQLQVGFAPRLPGPRYVFDARNNWIMVDIQPT